MKYEEYNGWTNWDTWNAYNWLTEDESVFRKAANTAGPTHLRRHFEYYLDEVDDGIQTDEVNWEELWEGLQPE
jgi:hypothetical protein